MAGGDELKKVRPGQRLEIPAETYNRFINAAIAHQALLEEAQAGFGYRSPNVIFVKNNTGAVLARFAVVGLDDVVYNPAIDEDMFKNESVMSGITPAIADHLTAYGIMQEPVEVAALGKCLVAGFTVVKLAVIKSWHKYAMPVDGSSANLESAPFGDAVIQWAGGAEGGAADWALVSIKAGLATIMFGEATTNWHKAAGDGSYVNVNPVEKLDGSGKDATHEVKVWLPRLGRDEDPNIVSGTIIPYMPSYLDTATPEGICVGEYLDGKIEVTMRLIKHDEAIPVGWKTVGDADHKTIAFNDAPEDVAEGFNEHGRDGSLGDQVNDHGDHVVLTHNIDIFYESGQSVVNVVDFVLTAPTYETDLYHDMTSNWPPWHILDLITRDDNSA